MMVPAGRISSRFAARAGKLAIKHTHNSGSSVVRRMAVSLCRTSGALTPCQRRILQHDTGAETPGDGRGCRHFMPFPKTRQQDSRNGHARTRARDPDEEPRSSTHKSRSNMQDSSYGDLYSDTSFSIRKKTSVLPSGSCQSVGQNMKNQILKTAVLVLFGFFGLSAQLHSQTVTTFEGIDASDLTNPHNDIDPNGAVGTKQYLEWTNVYFQAYDKVTFAPVWSTPRAGASPWTQNGQQNCNSIAGDGFVLFDHLAQRWVIGGHNSPGINGTYFYCIAVSNTDDLASPTLKWYSYAFNLNATLGTNSTGHTYFPDWPKLGTWDDAYYLTFDMLEVDNHYQPIGAAACALDRANMLVNVKARPMQCFTDPANPPTVGRYLSHSLIPADVEGTTAPPAGRREFLVSIQNPPIDGVTTTSSAINLWEFAVD